MKIPSSPSSRSFSKEMICSRTRTRTTRRRIFASGAFAAILLAAVCARAQTTNALSDKEIQGRQLVQKLLEMQPTESFHQTGNLKIRDAKGTTTNIPVFFRTLVTTGYWQASYVAKQTNSSHFVASSVDLIIIHKSGQSNQYLYSEDMGGHFDVNGYYDHINPGMVLSKIQIMASFAGSDFWIADLGLEFLYWPDQKILRGDTARGRLCKILESTNPNPSTNGYSRVDSWIDNETLGIVEAKAYDAKGKLLKEFYPKDVKKVDGQWQVGSMEIDNVQTKSSSWLKLDLSKK